MNDTQVVEVVPPPPSLQCLQLMLSPRGLGTALVTVHDIGLVPPIAASAVVILFIPSVLLGNVFAEGKCSDGSYLFNSCLFHLYQLFNSISSIDERFSYCETFTVF